LLLCGCPGPATDDDDSTPAPGDDDTTTADDDDAGDDDTTQGDDDTTPAFDFSILTLSSFVQVDGSNASGQYVLAFYSDSGGDELLCRQRMDWEGTATFGAGVAAEAGCSACTGLVEITEVIDVSNPMGDPDDCDPSELATSQADYGGYLTRPVAAGGGENLLSFATLDVASAEALGITDLNRGGTKTLAGMQALAQGAGYTLTHLGLIRADLPTYFGQLGLPDAALPATNGEDFFLFWTVFVDDPQGATEIPLDGASMMGSLWIVNSAGSGSAT